MQEQKDFGTHIKAAITDCQREYTKNMIEDAIILGIEVVKARVSQTFLTYYDIYSAVVAE